MIPADQMNQLVIMTNNGIELNIELLVRIDPGHVIFRGRVSGQNDDGRLFFLPYDQITYLNINRFVKEDEIRDLLGTTGYLPSRPTNETTAPMDVIEPDVAHNSFVTTTAATATSMIPRPVPIYAPPAPVASPNPRPVVAPPPPPVAAEAPGNAKSSILDRLRAQRTAMKGPSR
ncbi:MAG: hypothetical protein ACJ8C4_16890 [Gemmataceae bacterium]